MQEFTTTDKISVYILTIPLMVAFGGFVLYSTLYLIKVIWINVRELFRR